MNWEENVLTKGCIDPRGLAGRHVLRHSCLATWGCMILADFSGSAFQTDTRGCGLNCLSKQELGFRFIPNAIWMSTRYYSKYFGIKRENKQAVDIRNLCCWWERGIGGVVRGNRNEQRNCYRWRDVAWKKGSWWRSLRRGNGWLWEWTPWRTLWGDAMRAETSKEPREG